MRQLVNPWVSVSVGLVTKRIRASGMTKLRKPFHTEGRHEELTGFTRDYQKKFLQKYTGDSEGKMGRI